MEKSSNIFIKIDEFIFQKLDTLKSEGIFQKFNDALSSLEESQQKITAQVITFSFILLPYVAVGILWWGNSQTKKNLEIKKQIIEQIALFDGNKNALNNISANYLAPSAVNGRDDLENRIVNILSGNGIDQSKVTITNFTPVSTSSNVAKIEAEITFSNFGTNDFSSFMRALVENERFKILKVNLNKENSLLKGSISLMHMGQSAFAPEQ